MYLPFLKVDESALDAVGGRGAGGRGARRRAAVIHETRLVQAPHRRPSFTRLSNWRIVRSFRGLGIDQARTLLR